MATIYTGSVFKKFKVEVLGLASCQLQKDGENEATVIFRVDDLEECQNFTVSWNEAELKALEAALKHCVDANNSVRTVSEANMSANHGFNDVEEVNPSSNMAKSSKKKKTYKKRKAQTEQDSVTIRLQDSCQQMEQMKSRAHNRDNCYVPQQELEGEHGSRSRGLDSYYGAQQSMQGMGQLNSIAPICDVIMAISRPHRYNHAFVLTLMICHKKTEGKHFLLIFYRDSCIHYQHVLVTMGPNRVCGEWVTLVSDHQLCRAVLTFRAICKIWNSPQAPRTFTAMHQSIRLVSTQRNRRETMAIH
ncbi:hypothetical protein Pyn_21808 [Prunus yedoensis var. nudiflora]|uniref:Uncharacterized protein n=1 Tax=Prunus yedoensis var. nudiflora TaxID=2094558 RepID=A0A314YKB4_PRUYE|nr:hypothetical protein Pyn_21808 [Prunus yedoensis var. nudiflora]